MTGVIIDQIIIFALLMAVGLIAAKAKVFTKEGLDVLSRLIVKILLPAQIFSIIADSGVKTGDLLISGPIAIGVLVYYLVLIIGGLGLSRLLRLEDKKANMFAALFTFGNMGYMGIPLIQGIFREPVAQVCISVYAIVDMALLWTYGVYLCSRHQQKANALGAVKNMINPTTAALMTGLVIMIFEIPIPGLVMETITGIGSTTKYLTLIYLGGMLACVPLGKALKQSSIYVLTIVKMLVIPVFIYYILGFFLPEIPRMILTLLSGLPSMTTVAMLASVYQSDEAYATEIIFVTTLASLVTLPLVGVSINKL